MAEFATFLLGFAFTLMLHASVLLGAAWLLQRAGALRHPGWAEIVWRGALFGALLSASLASLLPSGLQMRSRFSAPSATVAAVDGQDTMAAATSTRVAMPPPPPVPRVPGDAEARDADAHGAPVPIPSRARLALPREAVNLLAPLWLAGVLTLLMRVAWRSIGLRRLLREARRAAQASTAQRRLASGVARQLGIATPTLRIGHRIDSPLALPGGTVLLPPWAATLQEPEARALLAHEFSHLVRRDPMWRVLQHLALAPLFAHPLAWLALRRLDALAEQQADAAAARLLGDGRPLAECLARCLAQQIESRPTTPRLALAMAGRPGAVVDRVQRLLEEDPMRYLPPSRTRTRVALALGLAAALFLPALVVTAAGDQLFQGSSISHHVDDDGHTTVTMKLRRGRDSLDLRMQGKIEFAPDESDVIAMEADAELEIEQTRDGITRSIAIAPAAGGVTRDYRVEGRKQAFDAEGRTWLAQVLPEMFRSSGYDAEARAGRILARGGVDALLDEIALIATDHGRARYLGHLFAQGRLAPPQQVRALELMRAIDSDYELRQALGAALSSQDLAPEQQQLLLGLAKEIDSDYERAELLMQALDTLALDDPALETWLAAVDGIGSDYEQRRVLQAVLQKHGENPLAVRVALQAARGIGSDYEKRQVLEATAGRALAEPALRQLYLQATADIGSDYERKEALRTLLAQGAVDADLARGVLDAVDGIGSDYERKEVLVALARVMPGDAQTIERYRRSARRLGDHERGEAERELDRFVVVL